jgi:hypothetical protein
MPDATFYDKQGHPIDIATADRLLGDRDYSRVALTEVTSRADSSVRWRISTVWLGTNHQWGEGPPLLFETMVFNGDSTADELMDRWSTEEEAKRGHAEIVTTVAATVHEDVVTDLA